MLNERWQNAGARHAHGGEDPCRLSDLAPAEVLDSTRAPEQAAEAERIRAPASKKLEAIGSYLIAFTRIRGFG
jgi:hypothetical protein